MIDERVIKANHCCLNDDSCEQCPYFVDVDKSKCKQMRIDTLDLLHRYKAENERLQGENSAMRDDITKAVDRLRKIDELYAKDIANAKAEVIKEFAENFKNYGTLPDLPWDIWQTFANAVDSLCKETICRLNQVETKTLERVFLNDSYK